MATMSSTTATGRLLSQLRGVRAVGKGAWTAKCPAHDDSRASLSITEKTDGTILVKCHANCATTDVLGAVGLTLKDLFPAHNGHANGTSSKPRVVANYAYHSGDGKLLFQVVRYEPKNFKQRQPHGDGWSWNTKGCPTIPYRLPELLNSDTATPVFVVEGEKDADRLATLGLIVTCNAGGCGKWRIEHTTFLVGRHVVVIPDNDSPGRKHAQQVAESLHGKAASVKLLELPGLTDKGDVSDWLDAGGTHEKLLALAESADEWRPDTKSSADKPNASTAPKRSDDDQRGKSQATTLVELALNCDLFHDGDGEAYARFPVVGKEVIHWEVSRVCAKPFRRWLKRAFYILSGKAPSIQSLQDALGVIEGKAVYDGDCRRVFVRIAEHQNKIYLDLCNDSWQAVEIDEAGWCIVDDPPVMFRRAKAMLPLPTPAQRGDISILRKLANVSDDDWPLLVAVLVAALKPTGPYPVLAVYGEHGSAKSTLCRYVRRIVDPNTAPLRADYREPRDLMICANSGWVVALDNLSVIQPWLSDCLCRLSTGGGFSTRTLYENDEETIFDAKRPVVLNCIDEVVTRSDLLDRCVLLNLPRIDADQRIPEAQLDREFDAALPGILGGLLTAVSTALRNERSVKLASLPRMADFAIWATAAEPAMGLQPGDFLRAYVANRAAGNETAIEASPAGKVLIDFVADVREWTGTATDLLKELDARADEKTRKLKSWPKTARTLGATVKRLAPNLREAGLGVDLGNRTGRNRTRMIVLTCPIEHSGNPASATSATSADAKSPGSGGFSADATADAKSAADATVTGPTSAENRVFPEENGHADATDNADAKIPTCSMDPEWCEV
jgi:hypothetical protein